jgi:hypothetical protein
MSDSRDDEGQNTQGAPNSGSEEADTASGGAPGESGQSSGQPAQNVDPDSGTDENGEPIENPSGG